jgi:hypothetical protein
MELKEFYTEHMASLTAIYYLVYWSICVAIMRSECKAVRHRDYDAEVVLMTKPQGKHSFNGVCPGKLTAVQGGPLS